MATTRPGVTDQDLLRLPKDGRKYELVDGEIRVGPAGARHGKISVRLTAALLAFVSPKRLGDVFDSSTGYRLPGGNVRSPDASFVSSKRLPGVPEGFLELAPDLAVEVLSPDDRPREVLDKVGEYLAAGVRLVWVIDPRASRAVRLPLAHRRPRDRTGRHPRWGRGAPRLPLLTLRASRLSWAAGTE